MLSDSREALCLYQLHTVHDETILDSMDICFPISQPQMCDIQHTIWRENTCKVNEMIMFLCVCRGGICIKVDSESRLRHGSSFRLIESSCFLNVALNWHYFHE